MDINTINIYNQEAERIAELHSLLTPFRIYELIEQYFIKNKSTADVGCGIGRDVNWLNNNEFPSIGVDASEGMLKQARGLYPNINFQMDYLPELNTLASLTFQNILCSAVLMHLDNHALELACLRLLQLLNNDGRLIISIRGTNEPNKRENNKLYESIDIEMFTQLFLNNQCEILLYESDVEQKRGLTWHNFVIRKLQSLVL
jgi:SAM-dependent methyltransferase